MASVTADLVSGYHVVVRDQHHSWNIDEPVDKGGTDTGATPYAHLLGALAGCTLITISMYATRKGMSLDSISARFTYDKVHADDCEDCDTDPVSYLDRIQSEVFIEGTFTEYERQRLTEIVERCPVHKTLENRVHFHEKVVVG